MQVLLDSHTLIWSQDDPGQLSPTATSVLVDPANDRLLSVATIWEIAIKVSKKKLPLSMPFRTWIDTAIVDLGLTILHLSLNHAELQSTLPWHHNDPFDRLLVSQSLADNIPIIGIDTKFDAYGVTRIWN